jgi:hypothetical protein
MKHSSTTDGIIGKNQDMRMLTSDVARKGQVVVGANGRRIVTEARPDLLDSNKGRSFYLAESRNQGGKVGYVGGADFVTNSQGERVIAGSTADDTVAQMKIDRRRKVHAARETEVVENG